nr:hypothetical protein [Tanacetum cinerariifolium]
HTNFKLEKKKFRVDMEVFHDILHICPRIFNQDFIAPPSEKELVTFIQELGYSSKCNMLSIIHTDQMHHPWRTFYGALIPGDMINQDIKDSKAFKTYYDFATRKVPPRKARKYKKVASPSRNLSHVKEAEPVKKAKRVKRPAKKSATAPTTGVVIKDTPGVSVSKKKAPAKGDIGKGIKLLSDATLLKEAQVPDNSKDKTTSTDEGTSTKPRVPNVPSYESDSDNESWGDSEDESNDINDDDDDDDNINDDDSEIEDDDANDAHESEKTNSYDDDENPSFTLKDFDGEEHDEKYESDDDYENVFEEEDDDLYKDTAIPETSTAHVATVPLTISMITPLPQLMTPSPAPTTVPTMILIPTLPDFSSLFGFDQRVSTLEMELSQLKQADHSAQLLKSVKSQLPTMVDDLLSTRIGYATRTALESYTKEFEKKAQEERKLYVDEVSDFATPVIQSTIIESLKNVVLVKSSSQPKSTYEAATSLTEFKLKKILLDKIKRSKSYQAAPEHRELYDGLKYEDPSAGSDRGLKKQKTSKEAKPPKGSKSKESKKSSSKGTNSEPKPSGKFVQAEESVFEIADTKMPQDQGGNTKDQPNVEATPMDDWFKKPNKPLTPDHAWNDGNSIDFIKPH